MTLDPYYATIIIGIVQLIGASSGIILMKTVCRRGLLLVSTAFCCLTMASLGLCIYMNWNWGSLVSLILFTFSHTAGLSPIPWILLGELPTGNQWKQMSRTSMSQKITNLRKKWRHQSKLLNEALF